MMTTFSLITSRRVQEQGLRQCCVIEPSLKTGCRLGTTLEYLETPYVYG